MRVIRCAAATALLASLLAGFVPAAQADQGTPSRGGASNEQRGSATDPVPGQLEPTSELEGKELAPGALSFTQITPARPGGAGLLNVNLSRESSTTNVRNLRIRINVPHGLRIKDPHAAGWKCRQAAQLATCQHSAAFGEAITPALSLPVAVSSRTPVPAAGRNVPFNGIASWDEVTSKKHWTDDGRGNFRLYPKINVNLTRTSDRTAAVTNADAGSRTLQLHARITNLVGQEAQVRWRQISGPKATFTTAVSTKTTSSEISQTVVLPARSRGNDVYRFKVSVESAGQRVSAQVKQRVKAALLMGRVAAREQLITDTLHQAPTTAPALRQLPSPGLQMGASQLFIAGPKRGKAIAGSQQKLTLRSKGVRLGKKVTWTQQSANGETTSTTKNGRSLTVKTPSPAHGPLLVTAHFTAGKPRAGYVESFTLQARPQSLKARTAPAASDSETALNDKLFCDTATEIYKAHFSGTSDASTVIKSKDGSELTIVGASVDIPTGLVVPDQFNGYTCDSSKGAITFADAKLTSSAVATFTNVTGTIGVEKGITIAGMSWVLEAELVNWAPEGVRTVDLKSGDLGFSFDPKKAGQWGDLAGTLNLQPFQFAGRSLVGFSFVPLPQGWEYKADGGAQLQFLEDEDKGVPAGSMNLIQRATPLEVETIEKSETSISISLIRQKGVFGKITGTVNKLKAFTTPQGGDVVFGGAFVFPLNKEAASATQLSFNASCTDPTNAKPLTMCEIAHDVWFNEGRVLINPTANATAGYQMSGKFTFGTAAEPFTLSASGKYKNADSWSMEVASSNTSTYDLNGGTLLISEISGVVQRGEEDFPDGKRVVTLFDARGSVARPELAQGVQLSTISLRITNKCDENQPDCQVAEVRGLISATVSTATSTDNTLDITVTGAINFTKRAVLLQAKVQAGTPIGPAGWNFKAASIYFASASYGFCQSADSAARAPSAYALGVSGEGTLFDKQVELDLQFSKEGSCVWGVVGSLDTGADMKTTGVVASWTNFPDGAVISTSTADSVNIKANTVSVNGRVLLPEAVSDFFKSAALDFSGEVTGKFDGGLFKVAYSLTDPLLVTESENSTFKFTSINLGFKWNKTGAYPTTSIFAGAEAALFVKGDGGSIPDSTTKLGAQIAFTGGGGGMQMEISAGITAPDQEDAFGVPGLVVKELGASAKLNLLPVRGQVSLAASALTPSTWSSAGFTTETPVSFAISVGNLEPSCIELGIGKQDASQVALDVANKGFLVANYFKLLIAPAGCKVAIGAGTYRTIPAGYGFAFTGRFLNAPIDVALNVSLGSNFVMKGNIDVPKLELQLLTLSSADGKGPAHVLVDIDSAEGRYDAAVDAGMVVGKPEWGLGLRLAVKGELKTSGADAYTLDFNAKGSMGIPPGAMTFDPIAVHLKVPKPGKTGSEGSIRAHLSVDLLGTSLVGAEIAMAYKGAYLTEFGALAGANLNIGVASVSGNLGFQYCLGEIGPKRYDNVLPECKVFTNLANSTPGYRFGLGGKAKFLFWSKDYYWTIAEQTGKESGVPFDPAHPNGDTGPTIDVNYKGEIPTLMYLNCRICGNNATMRIGTDNLNVRALAPKAVTENGTNYPPCSVDVGTTSYNPATGSNPPATVMPLTASSCGMSVAIGRIYIDNFEDLSSVVSVVCTPNQCASGKLVFTTLDGDAVAARGTLLSMLNQAPATIPAGVSIYHDRYASSILTGLNLVSELASDSRKGGLSFITPVFNATTKKNEVTEVWRWSPQGAGPDARYTFTARGQLETTINGKTYTFGAGLTNSASPRREPVLAVVSGVLYAYCGPSSESGVLWKVDKDGYAEPRSCTNAKSVPG